MRCPLPRLKNLTHIHHAANRDRFVNLDAADDGWDSVKFQGFVYFYQYFSRVQREKPQS